jgi:excisionase family DNA binding protein
MGEMACFWHENQEIEAIWAMNKSKIIGNETRRFVSTNEMGPLLGVSPRTIRNWIKNGDIKGYKIGHNLKITKEEAVRILRRYKQPIPPWW